MPSLSLTLDTGTSNTRVRAWHHDQLLGGNDVAVGVRDTARTGSHDALRAGVREAIQSTLRSIDVKAHELALVVGSGMVTSKLGLHELPHIVAPACIEDLATAMQSVQFDDILALPIWFIPGVRHDAAPLAVEDASQMDMMRGEETEVVGLLNRIAIDRDALILLPGSHAKFVAVQAGRTICRSLTTLSGELLDLLMHQSVLAAGLKQGWPPTLDPEAVLAGARLSRKEGLSRAAFSVRALELFSQAQEATRFSFLLGAVLVQDLLSCLASTLWVPGRPLIVCGRPTMQRAYAAIAADVLGITSIVTPDENTLHELAGRGALAIARRRGLL
ncbi:MAG: 2-dehydro-3-deoxygalactonokinase [Betaproteobacteria bacterium]|nr:2-dehydro-3-deoxygalactonokinase [Betaproteobacteria bacterium]